MDVGAGRPLAWLLDFFAPCRCALCGRPGEELCTSCTDTLVRAPVLRRAGGGIPPVVALGHFDGALRTAVHALKFRGRRITGLRLGTVLGRKIAVDFDILVPVPLHPARLRCRGFNQAEAIASGVAAATAKPVENDAIARVRCTAAQSSLDLAGRAANVASAFVPGPSAANVCGRRVLLVDDVVTTGSTLRACAAVLRAAGAASLRAAALAVKE